MESQSIAEWLLLVICGYIEFLKELELIDWSYACSRENSLCEGSQKFVMCQFKHEKERASQVKGGFGFCSSCGCFNIDIGCNFRHSLCFLEESIRWAVSIGGVIWKVQLRVIAIVTIGVVGIWYCLYCLVLLRSFLSLLLLFLGLLPLSFCF